MWVDWDDSFHLSDFLFNVCLTNTGGGITAVGARRIGRFLATNPQLRQLYLQHNRIDDEGACSLFDNIHHNTNLLTLDLSGKSCYFDGEGDVCLLFSVLCSLCFAFVADNLVTPQEISTFEEQMRTSPNTTLTVLFSDSASDLLQCFDGDICRSRRSNVLLELR